MARRASIRFTVVVALVCFSTSFRLIAADAPVPPVAPVAKGQPSPVDGVAVPTQTFLIYLNQQVDLDQANAKIKWRDDAIKQLQESNQRSWWERNGIWVGAAVGFVASLAVAWEVKQLSGSK